MNRILLLSLACLLLTTPGGAQDPQPSNTAQVLRGLIERQTKALDAEDPDKAMAVFHPKAPGVNQIRATLVRQFALNDDSFKLVKTHYVGQDGKWAYMRSVQTITGVREQKKFVTAVEELLVFRRHGREWRAWTSARLDQETRDVTPKGPRPPRKR